MAGNFPITPAEAEGIAAAVAGPRRTATAVHRVERLDGGHSYYLVVFADSAPHGLLVAVDSVNGEIIASARPGGMERPWVLDRADAARRLGQAPSFQESRLVWKPTRASLSPFYPLWEFTSPSGSTYVDQAGQIWRELPPAGPG